MHFELHLLPSINQVDSAAWDACSGAHPFIRHAFLKALEKSGAVGAQRGVIPRYAVLYSDGDVVACAPAMLKWGTAREYGPEARWLDAGQRAGYFAWPKFQLGIPWFPTTGPRVLVRPGMPAERVRHLLLQALRGLGPNLGAATVFNVMHVSADEARAYQKTGAVVSREWQSIWHNPGYKSLNDYLAALPEHKRSRFRKDRRSAEAHGLTFRVLHGCEITPFMLADYYEGHRRVCERHGHPPWLPAGTYPAIAHALANDVCMMGYFDASTQWVAGLMALISHTERTLYLLQWSEMNRMPDLALDVVCLRPIDYAIDQRMAKVDSGLTAPHKQLRNWHTEPVYNAHWFGHDALKRLAQLECGAL